MSWDSGSWTPDPEDLVDHDSGDTDRGWMTWLIVDEDIHDARNGDPTGVATPERSW